jgi:hypothetical protein
MFSTDSTLPFNKLQHEVDNIGVKNKFKTVSETIFPVSKAENTAVGIRHADHVAPSSLKSWH